MVRLDPGLAFGTGTHPSTALCLEWLDAQALDGLEVIDYGCGSGVLAIAALKLGARRAHAFDIDPQALLATRENAARQRRGRSAAWFASAPATYRGTSAVLLANILSGTLCSLAQQSGRRGWRCAAGCCWPASWREQAEVAAAYCGVV